MRIEELGEQLQEIGAYVSEKTLRRWGDLGLIEDHQRSVPGRGRGNAEKWSERALEEAAAVWAVSRTSGARLSAEMIKTVKEQAARVYPGGFAIYAIPPVVWSLEGVHEIPYTEIKVRFAPEAIRRAGRDEVLAFPGAEKKD